MGTKGFRASVRLLAPAAASIAIAAAWGSAAEAALPDRLCSGDRQAEPDYPTSDDLNRTAAALEARLDRGRGGSADLGDAVQALEVPSAAATPPTPQSIADYCAAAGEVMRISPQGSQFQAQNYLLGSFQKAQEAASGRTASRAAYRLGLVSLAGPAVAGARGVRNSRGGTEAAVQEAGSVEEVREDPCLKLLDPNLLTRTNLYVSIVSLECSAERASASGDDLTSARAGLRLARLGLSVAESKPDKAEAIRQLSLKRALESLDVAARIPDGVARAEILGRLIETALDLGHEGGPAVSAAIAQMRAAAPVPAASSYATALEGRIALAAGDRQRARALLGEALLLESQRTLPARLPEYYLLLARAEPERREAHISAAYEALESVRPLLPRFDPITEESTFSLYMRRVFESAVDVQLASADTADQPLRIQAAQQIVEAYRQAELQSVFGSECLPPRDPVRPQDLALGEVLLYPILLPDRVELLYVVGGDGGAAQFRRLPPNRSVDRQRISRLAEAMVLSMSYGEDEDWRAPARELYDILIKPIEGELSSNSVLAIIPDGPLRAVPFAALLDSESRYLIHKTRLTVAPSLAYSQPGSGQGEDRLTVIAASLQRDVTLPAGFFPRLEGTSAEARIATEVTGARVARSRFIEDFRKADLVEALAEEQADVLHLATHASFNGRSDRAFIVANGETIPLSELRQLIAQNRTRGDALDLLILSACETAVGDDEASMGLAGAAVQAGAMSAVASLWQVNDVGTAELMRQFYQRYRSGRSKSEALREAQLALLDAGGQNANPNIWAAFTLLGAWR